MIERTAFEARALHLIAEQYDSWSTKPFVGLCPQTKLSSLGFDSLDLMEMIIALEHDFGFDAVDEGLAAINKEQGTVRDFLDFAWNSFALGAMRP